MSEYIYLGYDNDIRLILKQNSVASDLASVTAMLFVVGRDAIYSTNNANDPIRWAQAGYATGEVRMELGGYKLITTWTLHDGSIWKATVSTQPAQLFVDTALGAKKTSIVACTSSRDWYWASNVLYMYYAADPDTLTSPGVQGEWPLRAGTYRNAPLIVYDLTSVDGLVWGVIDTIVYGRRAGGAFIP